ncbi:hypothetical protein ISN44_As11g031860 [Arabidopsis suecica]|uniref:Uncharacterized protein n=1 Tax=Arabidopsis suecica TaxID=45249 RepID=A0A8T1ZDC6_ARASU|nr:hypothetical protein ISN44_As11g031860 [Arabidopsis suecica]
MIKRNKASPERQTKSGAHPQACGSQGADTFTVSFSSKATERIINSPRRVQGAGERPWCCMGRMGTSTFDIGLSINRLLCEPLWSRNNMGVFEMYREKTGWFSKESLSNAIKSVMDKDSDLRKLVRSNHTKLKEILVSPGLLTSYVDNFVEALQEDLI